MFTIYTLSDSSGETAELVAKSALSQFGLDKAALCRLPKIRSADQIKKLFFNLIKPPGIIVYTLVLPEARESLIEQAKKYSVPTHDVLGDLVNKFENIFHSVPLHEPGLRLKIDRTYFNRMEAIHYAIKYDDGQNINEIDSADVVLVGVSGTGKTPTCMYLAQHYGLKAVNVPVVSGVDLQKKIFQINPQKIIGLICDPLILQSFRTTRASSTGYSADYFELENISKEIESSKKIFRELKCEVVDMTNRAVEDIAVEIIGKLKMIKV